MYHITKCFLSFFLFFMLMSTNAHSEKPAELCAIKDRLCIIGYAFAEAKNIENRAWRDQIYREIAKTYAFENSFDQAIAILEHVETPDTKAMTIRGIGMAIAAQDHEKPDIDRMFATLREEADKIKHPASYAIALTYIAMAQAFAGDNKGAWETAADMENDALRHKAYGETAEIQAEKGHYAAAKTSIEYISSSAFRNKAYSIVSGILADRGLYEDSYAAALSITNAYKKAQAIQYMLDAQKPRDVKH